MVLPQTGKENTVEQAIFDTINSKLLWAWSMVRYLAYSMVKILSALLFWGALGYIMHTWTGQGGFPTGDLIFLSWSVLLGLLSNNIYHSHESHIDTVALESPVHGSIALLFGILMATTIWLGVGGAQGLHTTALFFTRPTDFPNFSANPVGHAPKIFFDLILYFLIPAVAGMLAIRVGLDIGDDIAYHHDLLLRRRGVKEKKR